MGHSVGVLTPYLIEVVRSVGFLSDVAYRGRSESQRADCIVLIGYDVRLGPQAGRFIFSISQ
ncbi:hypothetical protein HYPDE_34403 [Hyphomicrobium denitrificans 1NES1]|uniref:Uncharacterized protein n=1 Tax=Hyphomicrobium denitrificans 1NES1 TaxID=670307 RepID=N0B8J1_9HYPH|nr:hypothetical protein HYPDE_34403 [Hyphomicrobium denitrificans 1NES1]